MTGLKPGNGYYVYITAKSLFTVSGVILDSYSPPTAELFTPFSAPTSVIALNDATTTANRVPLKITAPEALQRAEITINGVTNYYSAAETPDNWNLDTTAIPANTVVTVLADVESRRQWRST